MGEYSCSWVNIAFMLPIPNHFHITLQTPDRKALEIVQNVSTDTTLEQAVSEANQSVVRSFIEQWQPYFNFETDQGDLIMFVPDVPPEMPIQSTPVIIAEATSVEKMARTIGVCHLIENPPASGVTAVNSFSPLAAVNIYFDWFERQEIGLSGKVTLLQRAAHGDLKADSNQDYRYHPVADYYGSDSAIFLVEIGDYRVTLVYGFNVVDSAGGDAYQYKKFCPNGEFWKISPDGGITPLKRDLPELTPEELDVQNGTPTVPWVSNILGDANFGFCMNSNPVITKCVVPSRYGLLSLRMTSPFEFTLMRSLARAGRVM